jgi:DNA replication protein DnaC
VFKRQDLATSASDAGCGLVPSEPLRWVLHGGPGTGKSHTLKFLRQELFEKVLGWHHGVDFQIVSFQAVIA